MPWFKVDDGFWGHPKRLGCPLSAIGLWVTAGSWSAQQLTDGHIPRHVLPVLGGKPKDAAALVTAGLWRTTPKGWEFHDWADMQPSKASTEARRAEDAERKRQARAAKAGHRASNERPHGHGLDVRAESARSPLYPTRPDPTRPVVVVAGEEEVEVALGLATTDVEAVVRGLRERQA